MKETILSVAATIRDSTIFRGAVSALVFLVILIVLLLVLLGFILLLRHVFKEHVVVKRAHRIIVYLLTITGMIACFLGGLLGFIFPIIPGLLLFLAGLLLLRRIYKNEWVDENITWLEIKLHLKEEAKNVKKRIKKRKEKIGKTLRKKRGRKQHGNRRKR